MKKSRIISIIIAVCMLLTQISTVAFAEEGLKEAVEQVSGIVEDGQEPISENPDALEDKLFVASPSDAESKVNLSSASEEELIVASPSNAKPEACLSGAAPTGTALTSTSGVLASGDYYLADDLQLDKILEVSKDGKVTIDLNGHVLDGKKLTKGADRGVLYVAEGGELTIFDGATDADTEHYFKVESTGKWTLTTTTTADYVYENGELTVAGTEETYEGIPKTDDVIMVKGGCITGGHGSESKLEDNKKVGGAVYSWGKLTLNGVTIVGNTAIKGGAVYNTPDAEMTATDVHLIGNYAEQQGAGVFNKGTTTKNTISGCYISYNTATKYGAGISSTGEVEIGNCSITYNVISDDKSNYGAGMDWWGGKLKLSGTVVIADNVNVKSTNHSDNLFLEFDNDSDTACLTIDSLDEGSEIHVGHSLMATRNNIQIAACSSDYSDRFESDVDGYTAKLVDNSKINLVYKDCYAKSTGSDGDYKANRALGSYSSPLTLKNAIGYCEYYGVSTILLDDTITLTDSLTVPSGIEIKTDGKGKIVKLGNNGSITFIIKNEADLIHANTVSEYSIPGFAATWDIEDDIVIKENVFSKRNITVEGNGHSISGGQDKKTESVNHVLSFKSTTTDGIQIKINNLKVRVLDGFRGGVYFQAGEGYGMNAVLSDVSVEADRTKAPQDSEGKEKTGTLIQLNGGNLTVKGDFNAKTDKYCWSAIDLDDGDQKAKLTFDSGVSAAFIDGRTDLLRAKEPFIGLDIQAAGKGASVENVVNTGLEKIESGTQVTIRDIREKREKSGYDPVEYQITFNANGGTGSMESVRTLDKKLVLPENGFSAPSEMVFGGWIVGQNSKDSVASGTEVTFTEATTIYAKWRDESNVLYGDNWWNSTDSGWVIKSGTGDWYVVKDNALVKGWYLDSEDGRWYYLDPETGKMMTGWVKVDGKWYYFNPIATEQTWFAGTDGKWYYNKNTKARPFGSMYCNETTPDGYKVDKNGAWIQ